MLKRVLLILRDVVEVYVPAIMFLIFFVTFLLGIFYRYFRHPLTWTIEADLFTYLWMGMFAGVWVTRDKEHVSFTMVYDEMSETAKRITRLVGNALLLVSFLVIFRPSLDFILYMGIKKSNVFKFNMNVVYFPFMFFLAGNIVYSFIDIVRDLKRKPSSSRST